MHVSEILDKSKKTLPIKSRSAQLSTDMSLTTSNKKDHQTMIFLLRRGGSLPAERSHAGNSRPPQADMSPTK